MKKIVLISFVASLVLAEQIHQLNVPNMGCGGCASKIENAVKQMSGYKSMSYDLRTKDVNITTDNNTNLMEVVNAIKNSKEKKFTVGVK
ncbi:MAG: heavy-metal-associated domain-containing protein [Campylobacter sp.]